MKKLILIILIAFTFAIPQEVTAQSCDLDAPVLFTLEALGNDTYRAEWTAVAGAHDYAVKINTRLCEGGGGGYFEFTTDTEVIFTDPAGTVTSCTNNCDEKEIKVWIRPRCAPPLEFFPTPQSNTLTLDLSDTCPVDCQTTNIIGPNDCEVGSYTLCCDGSLTVNSTEIATHVKIYNISSGECGDQDGQSNGSACTLCGLWGDNVPCGGSWTFDPGTVTESNQIWLEFQSNSPWDEFDCDWSGTGLINLSNERAEMICGSDFAGGSDKNDETDFTTISAEISLSPNPANSFVNISNPDAKNLSVEIYNTNGQHLFSQTVNQTITTIDLNTLAQGLYLVHVKDTETQDYISIEKLFITK